jgi:hypothetical protein
MDAIIPNIKVASSAVGLITSELMQKLEEADQQPEERRARGVGPVPTCLLRRSYAFFALTDTAATP